MQQMSLTSVIPWRFQRVLLRRWPSAYQRLHFGTSNVNTEAHWSEAWSRHGKDGFRATGEMPKVRQRILEVVPPGSTLLDVGCGVGEMMELLRDHLGCHCSGVDIAPAGIAEVNRKGMEGRVAALPSMPFTGPFDVALTTETLEHVSDAGKSLAAIIGVLRPGGMLILSVPDGEIDEETTHVHRFTERRLRAMLDGMRIQSLERIESGEDSAPSLFVVAVKP